MLDIFFFDLGCIGNNIIFLNLLAILFKFTNNFKKFTPPPASAKPEIKNIYDLTSLYIGKKTSSRLNYMIKLREDNFYYNNNNVRVHHFDIRKNNVNILLEDIIKFKYELGEDNKYYKDPLDYIKSVDHAKDMNIFEKKQDMEAKNEIESIKQINLEKTPIQSENDFFEWFKYFTGSNDNEEYNQVIKDIINNINLSGFVDNWSNRLVLPFNLFKKRCLIIRKNHFRIE